MAVGQIAREKTPMQSWHVGDMRLRPVALGGCKRVLTEMDTHFGQGFVYPMVMQMLRTL